MREKTGSRRRPEKKVVTKASPTAKPRRWLKRVKELFSKWAAEDTELTLVYDASGITIQQQGKLILPDNDLSWFISDAGLRAGLRPVDWYSVTFGDAFGDAIHVRTDLNLQAFTIRESIIKESRPSEAEIAAVRKQFDHWIAAGEDLAAHIALGPLETVSQSQLAKLSDDAFCLLDQDTKSLHVLFLSKYSSLRLKKERTGTTVTLFHSPKDIMIELSELSQVKSLREMAVPSSRIH